MLDHRHDHYSHGAAVRPALIDTRFASPLSMPESRYFMDDYQSGYQTNMMVYGPGGYRLGDFFRVGAPMNTRF